MKHLLLIFLMVVSGIAAKAQSITKVAPATGQQGATLTVASTGQSTNFGQGTSTTKVWFSQGTNTVINAKTPNVLSKLGLTASVTIPATAPTGKYDVHVQNSVDGNIVLTQGFTVTSATATAVITSVSPNTGTQGQNSLIVTITGQNTHFGQGTSTTKVWFSQGTNTVISPTTSTVLSGTEVIATFDIPTTAPLGLYTTHAQDDIDGALSLARSFTVSNANGAKLLSISPNQAKQGDKLTVAITGQNTNFGQGTTTVILRQGTNSTITATNIKASSTTDLSADFSIPSTAATGVYTLYVNETPDGLMNLASSFTVNAGGTSGTAAIDTIFPDSAGTGQTAPVSISCSNTHYSSDQPTLTLIMGSKRITASYVFAIDDNDVAGLFNIPAGATPGLYDVVLSNTTDGKLTRVKGFKIYAKPITSIVSVSPNSGQQGQHVVVKITGSNTSFDQAGPVLQVVLSQGLTGGNTISPTSVAAVSATEVDATFDFTFTDQPGTYDVEVISLVDGLLTDASSFTLYAGVPPTIASFTPNTAWPGLSKLDVNITGNGTHFDPTPGNTTVMLSLNGNVISANNVTVYGTTSLKATFSIPSTAAQGDYTLMVSNTTDGIVTATDMMHIDAKYGAIQETGSNASALQVFPNPFSSSLSLKLSLKESARLQIELYDISGRRLGTLYQQHESAGERTIDLGAATQGLKAGMYILNVRSGNDATQQLRINKL